VVSGFRLERVEDRLNGASRLDENARARREEASSLLSIARKYIEHKLEML